MLNHIISLYCLASATSESKDPVVGSESVIPAEHQTVEDQVVHHRKVGHQTVYNEFQQRKQNVKDLVLTL